MQHQIPIREIDLLKDPPPLQQLQRLAAAAHLSVPELVNTRSQAFKKMKPDLSGMDEPAVADLVASNPRLLLRPLLVSNGEIIIGFKEKQYEAALA